MADYLKEYKGKKILVTGGAGCIGSNLARIGLQAVIPPFSKGDQGGLPMNSALPTKWGDNETQAANHLSGNPGS